MPRGEPLRRYFVSVAYVSLGTAVALSYGQELQWDFEAETTDWFVSENDPNTTSVTPATVPGGAGRRALAISGTFPGSLGASYTPTSDWRPYTSLKLAVFVPQNAPKDMSIYLYIKDKQYWWYQTGIFRATVGGKTVLTWKPGQWNEATVNIGPSSTAWEPAGHKKSWYRTLYY
ncbi:MAG: hypothetical protein ACUVX8_18740, partial [Candidatus Zipacnadales bacterium]